jgi:hypothetical protein
MKTLLERALFNIDLPNKADPAVSQKEEARAC